MTDSEPIKRLTYRDSTKVLYKIAVGILSIVILILIRQQMVHYMELPWQKTIVSLALACSVPLSFLLRLYFWVRPRLYSVYEIYPDQFIRVFKSQREVYPFSQIAEVKISWLSPRFLGGYRVRMNNGKKTVFLSALKGSHKLLELISRRRPELVNPTNLEVYLRMSRKVDVSWKRMKEKLSQWKLLLGKLVATPLFCGTSASAISEVSNEAFILNWSQWVVIYTLVAIVLEVILNSLEERYALSTVSWDEGTEKFSRDLNKERKIAQLFTGLFFLGMASVFFLHFQF